MFNGVREPKKKTYNVNKLKKGSAGTPEQLRPISAGPVPIFTYKRVNGLQKSDESHCLSLIPE